MLINVTREHLISLLMSIKPPIEYWKQLRDQKVLYLYVSAERVEWIKEELELLHEDQLVSMWKLLTKNKKKR